MDVTAETNHEGKALFLVAGKDGNNCGFTASRKFLPSEQMLVFQWIFEYALPILFSLSVIQCNQLCVTHGDKQIYNPFNQLQLQNATWKGFHVLCEWIQSWFWDIESEAKFQLSFDEFYGFLQK
jgi:hypothetical protein